MKLRWWTRAIAVMLAVGGLTLASTPAMAAVSDGNPAVTAVGQSPRGLAYSPNGEHLYVANSGSASVSDVDPATAATQHTITTTGQTPSSVVFSPDGATAYVGSWNDNLVSIIDVATHLETGTITALSEPMDVAVSPDGLTLYVAEYHSNTVAVFDLSGSTPVLQTRISVGTGPLSIAVSRFGDRVYVASFGVSTFSTIDATTNNVITSTQTGTNPYNIAISPDGSWLAVSHETSHAVYIYDLVGSGVSTIPLVSESYGVAFSPDSTRLFVTEFVPNMVAEIDLTNNNAFTAHTLVSAGTGPRNVAVSPNGCQIAATGFVLSEVSFLDASPCMGPTEVPIEDFPVTEKLASTGQDGLATLAGTAGGLLALLAGASILILRRRA